MLSFEQRLFYQPPVKHACCTGICEGHRGCLRYGMKAGPSTAANGVAALAVPGCQVFSRWCMGACTCSAGVRGALGPWRRVVWCGYTPDARGGRGLPAKDTGDFCAMAGRWSALRWIRWVLDGLQAARL